MAMFYPLPDKYNDLSNNDAYRFWLISRRQSPIVYHSGEMHWKRFQVTLRRAANNVRSLFAATRVALAEQMRRYRGERVQLGGRKHESGT